MISTKKKTVSFSQFSNWWSCPYRWFRDVCLKEKVFEDSIHMSFGTAIHEALQSFLVMYFNTSEKAAYEMDLITPFVAEFKRQVTIKGIKHTDDEFNEFVEDGKGIIAEFTNLANIRLNFSRDKWELIGIEKKFLLDIINNVTLDARLDIVLREKLSGDIRIIDLKTATQGWNAYQKQDFTKTSQLVLYKAAYSKANSIPLGKIHVEFIILKRKIYDPEKVKYEQTRIQIFKPPAFQDNVLHVMREFRHFVEYSFTPQGQHNISGHFPKQPGKNKINCKYCQYKKNGKCDAVAEPPITIPE